MGNNLDGERIIAVDIEEEEEFHNRRRQDINEI